MTSKNDSKLVVETSSHTILEKINANNPDIATNKVNKNKICVKFYT